MTPRTTVRRTSALALAVATLIALLVTPFASASPASPASQAAKAAPTVDLNPALIQPDALGRLIIHTYLYQGDQTTLTPGDGTSVTPPASAQPQSGVVFTVTRVDGVDLTTNAGWETASGYGTNGLEQARAHLGASVTSTPTDAAGRTTVANLPVGLYLVHELKRVAADGSTIAGLAHTADFLVTVPMTDPRTRDRWLYEVNVYPKTSRPTIDKVVDDGQANGTAGDASTGAGGAGLLTYTLTSDIPSGGLRAFGGGCVVGGKVITGAGLDSHGFTAEGLCPSGATWSGVAGGAKYVVIDDLTTSVVPGTNPVRHTSDFIEFAAADWTGPVTVSLTGASGSLVACDGTATTGCDFVLTQTATLIKVSLTDRGLAALAEAKRADAATRLEIVLQARVKAGAAEPGMAGDQTAVELPNTAVLIPSGDLAIAGDPIQSDTAVTTYATLRLHKVDQQSGADLSGAVFTVYASEADARAGRAPIAVSAPTDAKGATSFPRLHVGDVEFGEPQATSYWLVETKAPQGYVGKSTPFEVKLLSDGATVGADATQGYPVPNPKLASVPGVLAYTGSHAQTLLLIGLALVLTGWFFSVMARRSRRRDATAPVAS